MITLADVDQLITLSLLNSDFREFTVPGIKVSPGQSLGMMDWDFPFRQPVDSF